MSKTFALIFLLAQATKATPNMPSLQDCKLHILDFIMVAGDAHLIAVEDEIRANLAVIGIDVKTHFLSKESFNAAHQAGDFHLSFSETWGSPYDPHAFASGWLAGDEGHAVAMKNMENPSRDQFFLQVEEVLQQMDHKERETKWKTIHQGLHRNAIMLPLWGKRIPTVMNSRLVGYEQGSQQFDYPVHLIKILSGSSTVTIAPGAQTGLFQSVGRMDPHSYRPNEFFVNNWLYEGLVSYGQQGQVLPALAESWLVQPNNLGGQTYTFSLRPNVVFHDGTPWNCDAAKINFDHVMAQPLRAVDYHGWYGLPRELAKWSCRSETEFVVELRSSYYPFLQELSFIRPLRMLFPKAFVPGTMVTANSCPIG